MMMIKRLYGVMNMQNQKMVIPQALPAHHDQHQHTVGQLKLMLENGLPNVAIRVKN